MKNKSSYGAWTIIVLLFASYVFAKFQGGFVSWFMFYAFLPIGMLTLALYLLAFRGVLVEREIDKPKYTAGETALVTIRVKNPYRVPFIYVLMKDHVDPKLWVYVQGSKQVSYVGFKKEFTIQYEIENIPRGVYRWKDVDLETGDLFGLVKKQRSYTFQNEIVVYPKYQEIRYWRTINEKNIGTRYSFNRQDEDVSSVMGIRDYVPGDRLSRIHWKATARTNSLKTKEYEHQVTNDFMFFIDREQNSYDGELEYGEISPLFERAVSLTASISRFVLKQHFSAGLVSYGQEATIMNLSRDQEQLYRIFEHLARIQPDTTLPFLKTVLREVTFLPLGTTVVIISPKLSKKMTSMLCDLSYRKIKVEFFWIKDTHEATEQQKQYLALLDQSQISYYLLSGDHFSHALTGGGNHVSA